MFKQKLQDRIDRNCNDCNKCCDGHFRVEFNQEIIQDLGKSCKFLRDSKCSIYNRRPSNCASFLCLYLTDHFVPQWMKPNQSKVVMKTIHIDGIKILQIFSQKDIIESNVLDWIYEIFQKNKFPDILLYQKNSIFYLTKSSSNFINIKNYFETDGIKIHAIDDCSFIKERLDKLTV